MLATALAGGQRNVREPAARRVGAVVRRCRAARYQSQGRPVFVDFTASWCLSCQVNERVALDQPEVQQAFAGDNVALLRADWTRQDPAITQALAALGRSGVPAYALYAPGQSEPAAAAGGADARHRHGRAREASEKQQPDEVNQRSDLRFPALILRISSMRCASCFSRPSCVGW